jgi:hypothetical protein
LFFGRSRKNTLMCSSVQGTADDAEPSFSVKPSIVCFFVKSSINSSLLMIQHHLPRRVSAHPTDKPTGGWVEEVLLWQVIIILFIHLSRVMLSRHERGHNDRGMGGAFLLATIPEDTKIRVSA